MSLSVRDRLPEDTKNRVRDLLNCGQYTYRQVADILNKEGFKSAAGLEWTEKLVTNAKRSKWCGGQGRSNKFVDSPKVERKIVTASEKRITLELMEELYHSGRDNQEVADWLNSNGYVTPRGKPWESHSVNYHMHRYGFPRKKTPQAAPIMHPPKSLRAVNSDHIVPIQRQAAVPDDSALLESIYNSNLSANDKLILTKRLMGLD